MWETLEQVRWIKTLGTTGWMYASVSVIHYLASFLCVGSSALVDLRVAGLAARKRNVSDLAEQIFPWMWTGLGLALISGFMMFAVDAGDWAPDRVFHVKLAMVAISIISTIVVQQSVPKWARAAEIPVSAKIIAIVSLLLWILTILSASEIPAMEGLG